MVAPLAGAWIEISENILCTSYVMVAPLAGAWIEIEKEHTRIDGTQEVAPLAGAWIEIPIPLDKSHLLKSLPSRERGLKFLHNITCFTSTSSRSPRGSVD